MKKTFRLSALLCAMTLLVTSCSKNILDEPVIDPALNGTEIQFGSRAGFENANPNTRTVYSGETYDIGEGVNKKTFERIDWVTDDLVMIYSPQASGLNPAHYHVTKASVDEDGTDVYDEGYLTLLDDGGLHWNTAYATHNFYAMYPSPRQLPVDIQNLVGLVGTSDPNTGDTDVKINAYIPNEQHSKGVVANGDNFEAMPDMDYAYMAAIKKDVTTGDAVSLDFIPVVTALRVELHLPTEKELDSSSNTEITTIPDTYIGYVQLTCDGIAGAYTADLTKDDNEDGYPDCANIDEGSNTIGMLIRGNDGGYIKLTPGQSLFFTVFVRPGADINLKDIKVSYGPDKLSLKTKRLGTDDSADKMIYSLKKTSITGLRLPYTKEAITLNYEKWMAQLKDETKISELSILGTGGSFSASYSGSNSSNFKQQTLPVFTETDGNGNVTKVGQWDLGVRAFEMACDRPSRSTVSEPDNLDDQPIRVNKQNMGDWTIGDALRALLDKVTSKEFSSETAMAIITYQSEGGTYNSRNAYVFALALKNLYNTLITEQDGKYKDKIILYSPNTVLDGSEDESLNARGKLMIVARINQRGEGESTDETVDAYNPTKLLGDGTSANPGALYNWERAKKEFENIPILLVNGCGTAKDRWMARGYQVSSNGVDYNQVADVLMSNPTDGSSVEYYMSGSSYTERVQTGTNSIFGISIPVYGVKAQWRDFPDWNVTKGTPQYNYETNSNYQIWYQDWARVVDLDYIKEKGGNVSEDGKFFERGDYPDVSSATGWDNNIKSNTNGVRWKESYSEKYDDVIDTFDKAIAKEGGYVYINSLSGYLLDPTIANSWEMFVVSSTSSSGRFTYDGGTEGNIQRLAQKLNPAFGTHVRSKIFDGSGAGATGVVLMDYLSSDSADGASYYMPSVIISNNLYTGAGNTTPDVDDDQTPDIDDIPGGGNTGGGGDADWD